MATKATHYTSIHLLTLKTPLTLTQDALCELPFWYKNQHNYFQTIKVLSVLENTEKTAICNQVLRPLKSS